MCLATKLTFPLTYLLVAIVKSMQTVNKNVSNQRMKACAYTHLQFSFVEKYGPAAFLAAALIRKSSADRGNCDENERVPDVITCRFRS